MFSKTCEYAIKASLFVAQNSSEGNCIGVKKIAEGISAPMHFVAKILQDLSRRDIINSIKGPNGGFYFDPSHLEHSLADIVVAIDGNSIYDECVLGLKACSNKLPCPFHSEYKEIRKQIIDMIEHNTIGGFKDKITNGICFLK